MNPGTPGSVRGLPELPEAHAQAFKRGWFHTGDLGVMNARGFVTMTGQSSDMYISGRSSVYPREVEEALLSMPNLLEAAVSGVPDANWGERGVAVLVLRDAATPVAIDQVLALFDGNLAKYKWPRDIVF